MKEYVFLLKKCQKNVKKKIEAYDFIYLIT